MRVLLVMRIFEQRNNTILNLHVIMLKENKMIKRVDSSKKKSSKGASFTYKKRSSDDVRKRAEQTGGRFDSIFKQGFDTFRPKAGDNLIRILPPTWDDQDHYGYDVWVHKFIGPDNSNYLCPRKMKGEYCPICAAAEEAKEAGEVDEAKALQPSQQVVTWVLDRDEDPTPLLYSISWMADRDIASLCQNKRTGKVLLIDHPDEGYDVTIKRHGQGLKTRYNYAIDRDQTSIDDDPDVQDEILEYIQDNPIPDVLHFYDSSYLEKVLDGSSQERDPDLDEDEDEDEDEKPRRRRRRTKDEDEDEKPKRRRSRSDDDDDEPPFDSDEDEDEDEDDRPRRRRKRVRDANSDDEDERPKRSRRRRSAEDDDDDDDDDGDEEEEEDERSHRRRRSRSDDDDDDEDEKPRRRRRRTKDDDDDGDEDEDEDERPRRRRRRR